MALNARSGRSGETPGAEVTADEELLPCGRELSAVWEAGDSGRAADDPHMSDCPHCTAALADLAALDEAVRQARDAADPDPAGLTDLTGRIMDIVRLELRPGRTLPLGDPDEDAWIVEAAVARTFRAVAESLPRVRAGSCRIGPPDLPGGRDTAMTPAGPGIRGPVHVRLDVAAAPHRSLPELAETVRARVAEAARNAIGIEIESIDVAVVDLLDEEYDEYTVYDEYADDGHDGQDRRYR
ncbi:hypothetical protein [Streptomyces sp. NPDC058280]|uniref:hypothetical protein n=1 Tax=Streptomyces sp. NPDC058280 TaxID=3346419 RepID=UPI0036E43B01